ncbi:MAG TPA: hypothetical protein VGT44_00960 [Ktedonobacteraceae bacterium]|nr:hypothetical protein [Ktedonobacteraceae bacterium]
MSQQDLDYNEMNRDRPGFSSRTYEGEGTHRYNTYGDGDKLSAPVLRASLTAGQRLTLAIVSLAMIMLMTFGLIGISVATQAPAWVVLPILFILVLFTAAAVIINIVFNRKP